MAKQLTQEERLEFLIEAFNINKQEIPHPLQVEG